MSGPALGQRRTAAPQQALQAILGVTVAQWARAMRAEGAARRAAALEAPGASPAVHGRRGPAVPYHALVLHGQTGAGGGLRTSP